MILKGVAGLLLLSAIAIPGTIYVAKPELFGLGNKEKPSVPAGSTSTKEGSEGAGGQTVNADSDAGGGQGVQNAGDQTSQGGPSGGGRTPGQSPS